MLTIVYDENDGIVLPDAKVKAFAQAKCIEAASGDVTVAIGSDIMFTAFRLMVVLGTIKHDDVSVKYNDVLTNINENGTLNNWPKGMCDVQFKMIRTLGTYRRHGIDYTEK